MNYEGPNADTLGKLCVETFKSLPKNGKPKENEWTILSCILEENPVKKLHVVALGTGTKCIGQDKLCEGGLVLNDSHAEILARRSFLRYLYSEMRKCNENKETIFTFNEVNGRYNLRNGIKYHFFSTHLPCGDASIFSSKLEKEKSFEIPPAAKKLKMENNSEQNYQVKEEEKIFTGARLCGVTEGDLMDQKEGHLRIKPGKGVRTLSMSCSDKLSRWNILGVQGALLDLVLSDPIYLHSFTFCREFSEISVKRAIYHRWKERPLPSGRFKMQKPLIQKCSNEIKFEYAQNTSGRKEPASGCITWCNIDESPLEVSVYGYKLGATKEAIKSPKGSLKISKIHLFEEFCKLVKAANLPFESKLKIDDLKDITYLRMKNLSTEYQETWKFVKENIFTLWTKKPKNLENFRAPFHENNNTFR